MPRILQIVDSNSAGFVVRMDDGETIIMRHDPACMPCVGEEIERDEEGRWRSVPGGLPHLTVERVNSPAQVAANIASGFVAAKENVKTVAETEKKSADLSDQAPATEDPGQSAGADCSEAESSDSQLPKRSRKKKE